MLLLEDHLAFVLCLRGREVFRQLFVHITVGLQLCKTWLVGDVWYDKLVLPSIVECR